MGGGVMTNTNCEQFQPLLAACADGATSEADRLRVTAHIQTCGACAHALQVQQLMHRTMALRGRATADVAPPGLRTRIAANLAAERSSVIDVGWRTRLSAFAAAAVVVLALGGVALPVVTGRSTVVLAAQLALDHLKCFTIDGHDHGEVLSVAQAEAELLHDYGWQLSVAQSAGSDRGRLVAVRRCIYGDGRAAHLLYRVDGEPVSLFIMPGLDRPADQLSVFGHDEVVWNQNGRTFMLVGDAGSRTELLQMASNLRNGAE
jgi:anti-sigma factor RsiW